MAIWFNDELIGRSWLGKVVDNNDPRKKGRVRVHIPLLTDEIPVEELPWYRPKLEVDGKSFRLPDIGKLVSVEFPSDRIYDGEYYQSEHYNINLQTKLESLTEDEYRRFAAIFYDHDYQVYADPSLGAVMDYMKSNFRITPNGNMFLNLRDNQGQLYLGSNSASQKAVLGNHFMDWLGKFLNVLKSGGFLGNSGVPVIPQPQLLSIISEFEAIRNTTLLSNHVFLVDNRKIAIQERPRVVQRGDAWTSNENKTTPVSVQPNVPKETDAGEAKPAAEGNELTVTAPDAIVPDKNIVKEDSRAGDGIVYKKDVATGQVVEVDYTQDPPQAAVVGDESFDPLRELLIPQYGPGPLKEGDSVIPWPENAPPVPEIDSLSSEGTEGVPYDGSGDLGEYEAVKAEWKTVKGGYAYLRSFGELGSVPASKRKVVRLPVSAGADPRLLPNAADAFNALFALYAKTSFTGKQPLMITSGYRQKGSPYPLGTHAGIALDIWYGNSGDGAGVFYPASLGTRVSAEFRHPVYQWLYKNAPKFGISQPSWVYGGNPGCPNECWHWEFYGNEFEALKASGQIIHARGRPASYDWDKNPFDPVKDAAKMVSYTKGYKGNGGFIS